MGWAPLPGATLTSNGRGSFFAGQAVHSVCDALPGLAGALGVPRVAAICNIR